MRKGLWIALGACVLSAVLAAPAQAYLYWAVSGPDGSATGTTISRSNSDASGLTHSFIGGASGPAGLAVSGSYIYWANSQTNSIGRANLDGSAANPKFIQNATTASAGPFGVAVDANHIYWTDNNEYIGRANLDGSGSSPHYIDAGFNSGPAGIVLVAGTVYITEDPGSIDYVSAGSTTPHTFVTMPSGDAIPTGLAAGGGFLYWTEIGFASGVPSVGRVQLGVGQSSVNETFITGLGLPEAVAISGQQLYWSDHGTSQNQIGTALVGTTGASNINYDFISEPGGPAGLAVDGLIDPTSTSVSCSPSSVGPGSATACTATVSDAASSSKPTGTVTFSGDASTFFSGAGSSCTLAVQANGSEACTVGVDSVQTGTVQVHASYGGDTVHSPSASSTTFCSGSSSQCGGGSGGGGSGGGGSGGGGSGGGGGGGGSGGGPGNTHACVVPKLKGKTLAQARKLLAKAHCKLGKVKKAKAKKGHRPFVITSQQPAAGTRRPAGAKVRVHLKPRPRKRTK